MKLSAPGLIHKTEVGGVRLGIRGGAQAAAAFEEMASPRRLARFGVAADGVFVQEMLAEGLDLLVGAHGDEVFGPVLTIGAGGVAAEIDRDVAHLAIPFDDGELVRALRGLRLWPHLAGFRGRPPLRPRRACPRRSRDRRGVPSEASSIAEIEVNPLRVLVDADSTSCVALDIVALRRLPELPGRTRAGAGWRAHRTDGRRRSGRGRAVGLPAIRNACKNEFKMARPMTSDRSWPAPPVAAACPRAGTVEGTRHEG